MILGRNRQKYGMINKSVMNPKKTALIIISAFLLIIGSTIIASLFIRGYRPDLSRRRLNLLPTGLLVANSKPAGASVYIDGKLVTATNDTLNLPPGEYQIKIEKDGYLTWEKKLTIKKEVVVQTNVSLFRATPDLKPLTNTGALNPTLSPNGTKIVYAVTQASSKKKNGIWLLDLSSTLPLSRANNRQLTGPIGHIDWSRAEFIWSPDQRQILLIARNEKEEIESAYLIAADRFTPNEQLGDVSLQLELILTEWRQETEEELKLKLRKLPEPMLKIATSSARMITFSPDEERFFYLATASAQIPANLVPHPPARSTQPEERKLQPGHFYVYDLKEDTNFHLGTKEELGLNQEKITHPTIYWLDNYHLVFIDQEKSEIKVIEADATNKQTLYAGPFENSYVFPSPSGRSLIILTSLHPDSPGNLYQVKIR